MNLNLMLWLVLALSGPTAQPAAQARTNNGIPKDTVITLERTICFGACPIYKLTVNADGTVIFEGIKYVKAEGVSKGRISRAKLRQLIAEFERANYFSLRDSYRTAEDGCTSMATDMPSVNTSIQIRGRSKAVAHYLGCMKLGKGNDRSLQRLSNLERRIDEIVGTQRWIK